MIRLERTSVMNLENAMRGARNPMNSWSRMDSYYDEDTDTPNVAECIVAKNRHGETGTVKLEWRPEFTTFRNQSHRDDDEDL